MKVLNLRCARDHCFEGWFATTDEFVQQCERGLLACPMCDDKQITRLPSAPRLGRLRQTDAAVPAPSGIAVARARAQGEWLRNVRTMMKNTEDVGERFPEEARRIHYGEAEQRGIRGQATRADADALRDEGIEVVAVAVPEPLKGTVQ